MIIILKSLLLLFLTTIQVLVYLILDSSGDKKKRCVFLHWYPIYNICLQITLGLKTDYNQNGYISRSLFDFVAVH